MAKRYYTIFKRHLAVLMLIIVFVVTAAFTSGSIAAATTIGAGILLIGSAIRYVIWLAKTPCSEVKDECL